MGLSLDIPRVIPDDWKRLDLIVNKIKFKLGRGASPTFTGLTITGNSVFGLNSSVFQPATDSTTFFQVKNAAGDSVLNLDSTNRQVTIGKTSAAYPFIIKSTDGSDQVHIYHDNFNVYLKWTDGYLRLETDEGINTQTVVNIRGKGNKAGQLQVMNENNANYIRFYASGSVGRLDMLGTSPSVLSLQNNAEIPIQMFASAEEGETQELKIFGFGNGFGGIEHLSISVEQYAANTADFFGLEAYMFEGNLITKDFTHSDADGAGATSWIAKRERSGTEEADIFSITGSHDGTGDDELGKIVASVNTGAGLVEAMRIDSDLFATFVGRVGIGTASPSLKFDVKGTANTTFTNCPLLMQVHTLDAYADGMGGGISLGGEYGSVNTTTFGYIAGIKDGAVEGDTAGKLILGARPTGGGGVDMTVITILGIGTVGIGVTVPTARLHLSAGTAAASTAPLKLTSGIDLTTPEAGVIEYDGTHYSITEVIDRRVLSVASDSIVTSTSAALDSETVIYTAPISASELHVGKAIVVRAFGNITTNDGAAVVTIRVKLGAVTVVTLTSPARVVTNEPWHLFAFMTIRTVGAGGTVSTHGHIMIEDTEIHINVSETALNTTAVNNVTITAQWATTDAGDILTIDQGIMEILN